MQSGAGALAARAALRLSRSELFPCVDPVPYSVPLLPSQFLAGELSVLFLYVPIGLMVGLFF